MGKNGSGSGGKAVTTRRSQPKPAEVESSQDEEEVLTPAQRRAQKSAKAQEKDTTDSDEEIAVTKKTPVAKKNTVKDKKTEEMLEMVAFKFVVEDELHPFYGLNKVVGSVDIANIISNFNKDKVNKFKNFLIIKN